MGSPVSRFWLSFLIFFICLTWKTVSGQTDNDNAVDVVFIVDSSGTIGRINFDKVKEWLAAIISTLDVGSDSVCIGLVIFSTDAYIKFQLDSYTFRGYIKEGIANLQYMAGTSNTADALKITTNSVFNTETDRNDVPNLIVLLTDGGSNDKQRTAVEASNAKLQGIHILTVGIGNWVDKYELYTIATHPYQNNVILIPNYDELYTISEKLKDIITNKVNECSSSPCQNGGQCLDMFGMYVCQCLAPYGGVNCEYRCRETADFSLALESSKGIGNENFLHMLDFSKRLMMELPLPGSRMAFETFASDTNIHFHLNDIKTRMDLLNSMTVPFNSGGSTNIAAALRDMRNIIFTVANGDQLSHPNVGLVVTDGRSDNQEDTLAEAMQNRDSGIEMLALGVCRNDRMKELMGIASTSDNVFTVDDFSDLPSSVNKIRDAICNAVDDCSPNPCLNGGQCRDLRNGYHCVCQDGFTGKNCDQD